jgi:hypothetical protein
LLANLPRDIRELQKRLPTPFTDEHHGGQTATETVLARIQHEIVHDLAPGAEARLPNDDTVVIHACHGPTRQVEVLREKLLHLLAEDDTLQPRDIIVLCPGFIHRRKDPKGYAGQPFRSARYPSWGKPSCLRRILPACATIGSRLWFAVRANRQLQRAHRDVLPATNIGHVDTAES